MKLTHSAKDFAVWLRSRKPELAVFLLGALLRVSMSWTYPRGWAFDYSDHWDVVKFILDNGRIPQVEELREAFHPPFFYVTSALWLKLGVTPAQLVAESIACGIVRLGLIWAGLEIFVAHSRAARLSALALAAVLAASVHVDGMVHPEALNGLWTTTAMLLAAVGFRRTGAARWRMACAAGVVLGIGMLTKISASIIVASLGAAAACELLLRRQSLRGRLRASLPWVGTLGLCVAICGWYYARNVRGYHKVFLTSFDLRFEHSLVAESDKTPYLYRRTLGFFVGWDPAIFRFPYSPTSIRPNSQFFPVAVASTFVDYWNYTFSGLSRDKPTQMTGLFFPLSPHILRVSQYAVAGGTVIFTAVVSAWFATIGKVLRRHDFASFFLLLVPLITVASAMHFAIANPVDHYGVIKGLYMQFGAPPMYALFGLAVAWCLRKSDRWPLFALLMGALWLVGTYTIYCRLRLPLMPLG
ncbi:MAG: glycosyltransferase family 39 protein [Polyangiaceae bacterium]